MEVYYIVFADKTLLKEYIFLFKANSFYAAEKFAERFIILGLPGFSYFRTSHTSVDGFDSGADMPEADIKVFGIQHFDRIRGQLLSNRA